MGSLSERGHPPKYPAQVRREITSVLSTGNATED